MATNPPIYKALKIAASYSRGKEREKVSIKSGAARRPRFPRRQRQAADNFGYRDPRFAQIPQSAQLSTIAEIFRDLFIVVGVLTALLVVSILVIARMCADNPLKRLLRALSYRMGATIVAGVLAIPIEPVPGLDVLYDLGAPLLELSGNLGDDV
jgi:hypothetical protein